MTTRDLPFPYLPLFVPGDRPERFAKAALAGADAVIVDLEDAVAADGKAAAREGLAMALGALPSVAPPVLVRVNAAGTPFFVEDIEAVAGLPVAGIVLPKAADPAVVTALRERMGDVQILALVETPEGLARARELALTCERLAFGSLDYAVAIGARHVRHALQCARHELVLASALAGIPGPLDGVTTTYKDEGAVADDAAYASDLGFAGKLLIHPAQVSSAIRGFSPTQPELERAEKVLQAAGEGGAVALEGAMVDEPVIAWAREVMKRAARAGALAAGHG